MAGGSVKKGGISQLFEDNRMVAGKRQSEWKQEGGESRHDVRSRQLNDMHALW